jgi:predicted Zn-dependent protease
MGVLTELRAQNPKGVDAYVLQARLLKGKGKMDEAMALLKAGLDAGAKRGPLLFYLAEYYFDTGDFEAAQKFATEANAAGMKMDRLWSKLPESYGGRGD